MKEPIGEASCIQGLGDIALQRNEFGAARQRYEAALQLFQKVEVTLGQGGCHFGMARIHRMADDILAATAAVTQALRCYERDGHPYAIGAAHALWARLSSGEEQMQHKDAARDAWRALEPQALAAWAALDGLDPKEIMAADIESIA